jgi:hypothetical protein
MWWLRYQTPLNQGASSIQQVSISPRAHNVAMDEKNGDNISTRKGRGK